jgi:hypothetical protein
LKASKGSGKWEVGSGKWAVGSGQWAVGIKFSILQVILNNIQIYFYNGKILTLANFYFSKFSSWH